MNPVGELGDVFGQIRQPDIVVTPRCRVENLSSLIIVEHRQKRRHGNERLVGFKQPCEVIAARLGVRKFANIPAIGSINS